LIEVSLNREVPKQHTICPEGSVLRLGNREMWIASARERQSPLKPGLTPNAGIFRVRTSAIKSRRRRAEHLPRGHVPVFRQTPSPNYCLRASNASPARSGSRTCSPKFDTTVLAQTMFYSRRNKQVAFNKDAINVHRNNSIA